jgi:hypothetical protein
MAINLNAAKQIFKGGISNSWTDFYLNMALEMSENYLKAKGVAIGASVLGGTSIVGDLGVISDNVSETELNNTINNYWFAQSLTEEYDKVIKGGKTLIGGVPFEGNVEAMERTLFLILNNTTVSKTGDLLRDIGPAIQAYWLGAQSAKIPVPNIPCAGAVANLTTNVGFNLSPGIWTPIIVNANGSISPFLLNFIISASVHLLTVGGLFICNCTYPPPAPPAPGLLPWAGYFVKPFSGNPLSSLDFKDMRNLALLVTADTLSGATNTITQNETETDVVSQLATTIAKGFIEGEETQEPQIAAAIKSIIYGDEAGMVDSSTLLSTPLISTDNFISIAR